MTENFGQTQFMPGDSSGRAFPRLIKVQEEISEWVSSMLAN
jgi:hypothetical protein